MKREAELKSQLQSLVSPGRRVKSATLGGDPEQSFEQAFASLAYTYIQDKAPKLLDSMVGFQLVERNEDNTRAVGIFGFKPGDQWLYGPVFFLNGDLKGHELLYLKNQDQFVPMKENWINKLLNRKPRILGEPTGKNLTQLGVLQPDIRSLSIPPYYSKYGSAKIKIPEGWPQWMVEAAPALGDWATGSIREKFAGLDERLHLPKLLGESLALTKAAAAACRAYPQIDRLCRRYYGDDFLKRALLELRAKAVAASKPRILGELAGRPKQAADLVEIRVREEVTITRNLPELTESEREKLLRDGVLIRDRRKGEEVSRAYDTQVKTELVNPDASGIYDVLVRPGGFRECLIVNNPHTSRGRLDFATVVSFEDGNSWLNVHRNRIYVQPDKRTREEQAQWFDSRSSAGVRVGGTYIVVCRSKAGTLEGSTPFTVRESLGDGRYRVTWHDMADRARPTYLRLGGDTQDLSPRYVAGNGGLDDDLHSTGDLLWFNEREGSRFKSVQGALMVPPEAKVLVIDEPYTEPYDSVAGPKKKYEGPCERSNRNPIDPGDIADVQLEILQKTASLKLWADDTDVSINSGPRQSRKSALIDLVKHYGFREKTARHLIREAAAHCRRGKPALFRVKYAQGYPMIDPGPSAPALPPQELGVDGTYGGVPTAYLQTNFENVPELAAANTDPGLYDPRPEAMPDPMAMQAAQQAGQLGQKEVFDTAMIAGLLKAVRQDSLVDRYIGDLMKALDRLGRLLFQFYWHNDAFMDRYGKSDMPELEDTLRNAFEVLGDLVLFLREKDVEPLGNLDLQSPTVEETAE